VKIKPIRSAQEHSEALEAVSRLIDRTDEASVDRLLVYEALINQWERNRFQIEAPTPAEAIKFRMEQLGLQRRDLIPYFGTKSRVSEILNGQRQPTVDQIRALKRHLGIPADSLIGAARHEPSQRPSTASAAAVQRLRALGVLKSREPVEDLIARASQIAPAVAMLRKTRTDRTNAKTDLGALEAWCAAVLIRAESEPLPKKRITRRGRSAARALAKLSALPDGPAQAKEFLRGLGVVLVILEHLPGTYLDGAAICRGDGAPVIALTLRHDRIDNFWFTLLHEFAHVCCHLGDGTRVIVDDLDVSSSDEIEAEADQFARDALVPPKIWANCASAEVGTTEIEKAAHEAGVHPAIVAGRWRWENGDYRRFAKLLGHGEVRKHFA
jgi:HTH-type transcriptional regulator/antitoxin HigA